MSVEAFNPAKCRIVAAEIYSFDLTKRRSIVDLITAFSITQSIESTSYRGTIRVLDLVGLLSEFPLRGEERLLLRVVPGNEEFTQEIDLELQIYRIDNVTTTEANDGVSYIAHFVSYTTYLASRRKIITSYPSDSAHEVVRKLFENYFAPITGSFPSTRQEPLPFRTQKFRVNSRQSLYIQPTVGISNWLIPNYTSQEAMYFLMTRAYSGNGGNGVSSSSFRFFETLNGYYFVTDEFLIQRALESEENAIKTLVYNPFVSKDPRNISEQIRSIEVFENQKRVDSGEDLHSGGYTNKVIEIDLLRRSFNVIEFDYLRDGRSFIRTDGFSGGFSTVHTEPFIQQTFTRENARVFNLYRDYTRSRDLPSSINGEQNLAEIVSNRVAYQHHLNNTIINASLKGRIDILPGDLVNIETAGFVGRDNRSDYRQQLRGNYLVHSVNLVMEHEILNTALRLIKYDWSE